MQLLEVEEALSRVLAHLPEPRVERVVVAEAYGRVLAEPVTADRPYPPFRRSRVDGYALRAADAAEEDATLPVAFEVPAGAAPGRVVEAGQAARIFTGAAVPEGADTVVMQEYCEALPAVGAEPARVRILKALRPGQCFIATGGECAAGEPLGVRGERVTPALVGVLASVGASPVAVFRRPRATVVSTGDELVPPEQTPGPGRIRNSNSPTLLGVLDAFGAETTAALHSRDDEGALRDALTRALDADVCILTGGVSVGDYDLVPGVLESLGVERVFHGVAMQPGKPVWFGVRDAGDRRTLVYGLPGNPVSAVVAATLFVRPAVERLLALGRPTPASRRARLTEGLGEGKWRRKYVPVRLRRGPDGRLRVTPIRYAGSGDIFGLSRANALAIVPARAPAFPAGHEVDVVPLSGVPA